MSEKPKVISSEELGRWQAAEAITDKSLNAKWEFFAVDKAIRLKIAEKLKGMNATQEIIDALGLERIIELMLSDSTGEEVRALFEKKESLQSGLKEMMEDREVRAMAQFRLENLQRAYNEQFENNEKRKAAQELLGEHLGKSPKETRVAEYEAELTQNQQELNELEKREESLLTTEEKNKMKVLRAIIVVMETQIKNIGNVDRNVSLEKRELIKKQRDKIEEFNGQEQEIRNSNPEAFLGLYHADFRKYVESLNEGHLVETPFVKEHVDDITTHLQADIPVMIYGHLGSGKTELAMYLAKTRFSKTKEQEERKVPDFYMISGSKHIVPSEFYGHQVLTIPGIDEMQKDGKFTKKQREIWEAQVKDVADKFDEWQKENPEATEEEKNRHHQTLLELYSTQLGKGTISDYILGPVYEAMREGRPLIIDEVNAIPHEVLISLNYILTRKAGDEITVQQDSGMKIKIKKGFCIMMTGNLNQGQEQYIDRKEMDPAFLSRLHRVSYDYLPQDTEGGLDRNAGPENELYQLVLAKIADKDGNIVAPKKSLKKLWNMAQAARLFQNVFAGKEVDKAGHFQESGSKPFWYMLKKSTFSLREIGRILDVWKGDNYQYELDHYLYNDFVGQATDLHDRAYLYQILWRRYEFFKSDGWSDKPNYGTGGNIRSFDIKSPKNKSGELEFLGPREIVEASFGHVPERTEWPDFSEQDEDQEMMNYLRKKEELLLRIEEVTNTMPDVVTAPLAKILNH